MLHRVFCRWFLTGLKSIDCSSNTVNNSGRYFEKGQHYPTLRPRREIIDVTVLSIFQLGNSKFCKNKDFRQIMALIIVSEVLPVGGMYTCLSCSSYHRA